MMYLYLIIEVACSNHQCDNGGTCRYVNEEEICDCADGYTGTHCETGNYNCTQQ